MTLVTLLSQTGVAAPAPGGIGPIVAFPSSDNVRTFQINAAAGAPLNATMVIQGSNKPSPGAGDFQTIATISFTGHTTNFSMDVGSNFTSVQVKITAITSGQVAVFGDSRSGALTGGTGTTLALATAVVSSQLKVGITGQFVHVSAPVVPSITSDDVVFALDFNRTVTDELVDLKAFVDPLGVAGVDTADLAILAGVSSKGDPLTNADLCKLAQIDASSSELNFSVGVTSGIQAQLDAVTSGFVIGAGIDLTGLTATVTDLNTFFDGTVVTISVATVQSALSGLTATSGDLNALAGTAGDVFAPDFVKLGDITASAVEINVLNGLSATTAELNKLAGLTTTTTDLNVIDGLTGAGISLTEFAFLNGLTENVQAALNTITPLPGLTASAADLNLLTGAFTGVGAFAGGAISSAEIAHINGLTSNIQGQLDAKRNTADTIGVAEITGSSITTTELNFSSGLVSNIQAQIDAIGTGFLSITGGTMTGALCIADGVAAAPGLCLASSATTGLYLEGAPGVGLTIAGTRFSSWNGTDYRVGPGLTMAEPIMKGSGFGETDPQFSFVDSDTGMFWGGANILGFSAAGERMLELDGATAAVTVGGPAATNNSVTISGVFDGEKLLGVATSLDATSMADTLLYTVPAGRSAVVTKILVIIDSAVVGGGSTATLRMNIGFTGALFDELVDNVNNTLIFNPAGYSFDTANQVMPLGYGDNAFPAIAGSSGADYQALTAGATLNASVQTASDFTTLTFRVAAFGYEF